MVPGWAVIPLVFGLLNMFDSVQVKHPVDVVKPFGLVPRIVWSLYRQSFDLFRHEFKLLLLYGDGITKILHRVTA